jgi:hypothetical protein
VSAALCKPSVWFDSYCQLVSGSEEGPDDFFFMSDQDLIACAFTAGRQG